MWKGSDYNVQAETTQRLTITHAHTYKKAFLQLTTGALPERNTQMRTFHVYICQKCTYVLKNLSIKENILLLLRLVIL